MANAITEKGVTTATDATFAVMGANILNIVSGSAMNLFTQITEPDIKDGIWIKTSSVYEKAIIDNRVLNGSGVWTNVENDLPQNVGWGGVCFYHGKLHFLSSNVEAERRRHTEFNPSDGSWRELSATPVPAHLGICIVYEDKIHIMGMTNNTNRHFVYNCEDDTWTELKNVLTKMPYPDGMSGTGAGVTLNINYGCACVYNGELHVFGKTSYDTYTGNKNHIKYNQVTDSWSIVDNISISNGASMSTAVVYNGEIHIIKHAGGTHIKYSSGSWITDTTAPGTSNTSQYGHRCACVYNGRLYWASYATELYIYNDSDSTWTLVGSIPYASTKFIIRNLVAFNDKLGIFGGTTTSYRQRSFYSLSHNVYDPKTLIIQKSHPHNGPYITAFCDTNIIEGSRFASGFDDAWFFDKTDFDLDAAMYYGDGTRWIKFKN